MNNIVLAGAVLFVCAGWCEGSQAQVAYTDTALDGCYATRSTSVDTGSTTVGRAGVGTLCFDGKGHIVGTTGTPALSGHVGNTDGNVHVVSDQTGAYKVTNAPGDGMGVFEGRCAAHRFVLRNVDSNGLAHGFDFILTRQKKGCKDNGPMVAAGGGEYQGPLK